MTKRKIVDVHAHLCDSSFDEDRAEVLARAWAAGVVGIVAVGEDLADARRNLELAEIHPMLLPAAGLYPTVLDMEQAEEMEGFIRENRDGLVAIGEVGLDYWIVKEESERALQREIFGRFVDLSAKLGLPLNVHARSAGRHAVAFLLDRGARKVLMHAFDGKAAAALPALEAGYFFSIPSSVVRSRQKQKLVKRLPLSHLLLETDSPVLGPTPDVRNEPANIVMAAETVAGIKNIPVDEVIETVYDNTRRLFGRLARGPGGASPRQAPRVRR